MGSDVILAENFTHDGIVIHTNRSHVLGVSWKHVSVGETPYWLNGTENGTERESIILLQIYEILPEKRKYASWRLNEQRWERVSFHCNWMYIVGDCTTAKIAVFVCQGCQQGENEKQLPKRSLRHTRKRPSQEGVARRPWPEKGVLGRGERLQRPVSGTGE